MTIGVLFGDLVKALFTKPATQNYPFTKTIAPERLRGKLVYDPEKCVGCMLCMKDCPSNAIELITVDKINKDLLCAIIQIDVCFALNVYNFADLIA